MLCERYDWYLFLINVQLCPQLPHVNLINHTTHGHSDLDVVLLFAQYRSTTCRIGLCFVCFFCFQKSSNVTVVSKREPLHPPTSSDRWQIHGVKRSLAFCCCLLASMAGSHFFSSIPFGCCDVMLPCIIYCQQHTTALLFTHWQWLQLESAIAGGQLVINFLIATLLSLSEISPH